MTLAESWAAYQDAMAKVREAKAVTCLRCGKPMTSSDHWDCQHDDAKLRMYEEASDEQH